MELALMAEAGMSPAEVLVASTSDAARCVGQDDIGSLSAGKWADFVVLDEDPLADVANLRSIESVWIAGNEVPGRNGFRR
jgi:imidazolonepropionase-like amidohydrolase